MEFDATPRVGPPVKRAEETQGWAELPCSPTAATKAAAKQCILLLGRIFSRAVTMSSNTVLC